MGSLCSTTPEKEHDNEISRYMTEEEKKSQQIKLLLLGCGSAGKSTLFKSLRISHTGGLDSQDLLSIIPLIRRHSIESILKLFHQSQLLYQTNPEQHINCNVEMTEEIDEKLEIIKEFRMNVCLDDQQDDWENVESIKMSELANCIEFIWNLDGIQATYHKRGTNFALEDNSDYYFNKIHTIFDINFVPSEEDYLKAKQRTIGMIDYEYQAPLSKSNFRIVDVGGQRSERRKWISLFHDVDGLIFVAALSSYNAVLYEDGTTNSMLEAVSIFSQTIAKKYFDTTALILILNKNDIFKNMIRNESIPLSNCFSKEGNWPNENEYFTYDSEHNIKEQMPFKTESGFQEYYATCIHFIQNIFRKRNKRKQRKIYTHITVATDGAIVSKVFADVQTIIIKRVLRNFGLIEMGSPLSKIKTDKNDKINIENHNDSTKNDGNNANNSKKGVNTPPLEIERVHSTEPSLQTEDEPSRNPEVPPMKSADLEKL